MTETLYDALKRMSVIREGFVVRNLDGSAKSDKQAVWALAGPHVSGPKACTQRRLAKSIRTNGSSRCWQPDHSVVAAMWQQRRVTLRELQRLQLLE